MKHHHSFNLTRPNQPMSHQQWMPFDHQPNNGFNAFNPMMPVQQRFYQMPPVQPTYQRPPVQMSAYQMPPIQRNQPVLCQVHPSTAQRNPFSMPVKDQRAVFVGQNHPPVMTGRIGMSSNACVNTDEEVPKVVRTTEFSFFTDNGPTFDEIMAGVQERLKKTEKMKITSRGKAEKGIQTDEDPEWPNVSFEAVVMQIRAESKRFNRTPFKQVIDKPLFISTPKRLDDSWGPPDTPIVVSCGHTECFVK